MRGIPACLRLLSGLHFLVAGTACYLVLLLAGLRAMDCIWSAFRYGKYREGFGQRNYWDERTAASIRNGRCIWFHAVSVGRGELYSASISVRDNGGPTSRLAIGSCQRQPRPAMTWLAAQISRAHSVFYCTARFQLGRPCAAMRSSCSPDLLVLAELELWPNLDSYCPKNWRTRVAIVNGRLE